jgi:hypothetical protein
MPPQFASETAGVGKVKSAWSWYGAVVRFTEDDGIKSMVPWPWAERVAQRQPMARRYGLVIIPAGILPERDDIVK